MKSYNTAWLKRWLHRLALGLALAISLPALAAEDRINTTYFGNLAIKGYDTVAYFKDRGPVKGSEEFEYAWMGATWRFSSAENLASFIADPEQYAPQYGGYCAYAVAKNKTAGIDPSQFTVHEGKLYLNYNNKIQGRWLADRDNFIDAANRNWPGVLN